MKKEVQKMVKKGVFTFKNLVLKKISRLHKLNDEELKNFFEEDFNEIIKISNENKGFKKSIINEICNIILFNLSSKNIGRITKIFKEYKCDLDDNCNNLIYSFFDNMDKQFISVLKKWISSSKYFKIKDFEFYEFLIASALVFTEKGDGEFIKEHKIKHMVVNLRNESGSMDNLKNNYKRYNHLGILKIVDVFSIIKCSYMYDEEVLNEKISLKRKYNYLATYYGLFDLFEEGCRLKFAEYYSENITNLEVERANFKHNFKWKKVNHTVFIDSLIDSWYVVVDKIEGKMTLYHNNNCGIDTYHIQKVFRHTNLKVIFDTIHRHDVYSLNRFDGIM